MPELRQGDKKSTDEDLSNDPTAPVESPLEYADDVYYGGYVDFEVPWSFTVDYNFRYIKRSDVPDIVQSVRFRGDFSLTPKWKIGFNSGYDFKAKKISVTNISIYRDLHCWEMSFNWQPTVDYYSFRINVKADILQDLKLTKHPSGSTRNVGY